MEHTQKKKIVVTGATGLVGSHILDLLHQDYVIYALVRQQPETYYTDVTYIKVDFNHTDLSELPEQVDAVIHLAQSTKMRDFPLQALDVFNLNVRATALLLDYAYRSKATHFIFASTGGVYGNCDGPCKESMDVKLPGGALSYYFSTKYAAEQLIQTYSHLLTVNILRPFFIYGKKQKHDMFIPRLMNNIKLGNPITLQGLDGINLNPVHVTDVVRLIFECLNNKAPVIINAAGNETYSIRAIAELIGENLGVKPVFELLAGNGHDVIGDNALMKALVREPLMSVSKGLKELLA